MNDLRQLSPSFHLLIKPIGAQCNLRCDYCFYLDKAQLYADEAGALKPMDLGLVEDLLAQYIEAQPPGMTELSIAWQGGEPTLCGLEYFRSVIEIQKRVAPPGLRIINGFQTNGVLIDREWAKFFKENRFLVGISIDGPEPVHNRYRKSGAGHGSFSKVLSAIELLSEYGVDFNTMTTVSSANGAQGKKVYRFLKEMGAEFMQFIPIVEPHGSKPGQVSTRTVKPYQWGKFLVDVFEQWVREDVGRVFVNYFDATLAGYVGVSPAMCSHNRHCGRSLVAERNGDIYSCDHFVDPDHRLGNLRETDLEQMVFSTRQEAFGLDKDHGLTQLCQRCRFRGLCYGECPKNRIVPQTSSSQNQNWLCRGFQEFYSHSEPIFRAMARALQEGQEAKEYQRFL